MQQDQKQDDFEILVNIFALGSRQGDSPQKSRQEMSQAVRNIKHVFLKALFWPVIFSTIILVIDLSIFLIFHKGYCSSPQYYLPSLICRIEKEQNPLLSILTTYGLLIFGLTLMQWMMICLYKYVVPLIGTKYDRTVPLPILIILIILLILAILYFVTGAWVIHPS